MRIEANVVVTLGYELRDADGQLLEDEDAEISYLHGGYGNIFPKVEESLAGKESGAQVRVTLEPADAFGEYDAQLLRVEPRERFPEALEVGMHFEGVPGEAEDDAVIYTVTDITPDTVVVDGNHPLAGERLWFSGEVKDVRPATEEELTHGHAHAELGLHTH